MRPIRYFLLILVITLGGQAAGHAQSSDNVRLSITKDVMDELAHTQLALVRERFSSDLKDSLTQDEMKLMLNELAEGAGAFQKHISQETRIVQGMSIYVSKSQFEKFTVELRLMFNDSNEITNFWIAPISDLSPENMETLAKTITDLLRQERFEEVNSKFDDRMKIAMPARRLGASWSHVIGHLGQFKSIRMARKDIEFDRVDVRCEFENGQMTVRIAFDPTGRVRGLWMLPVVPEKNSQI
jgi:hypothetical protein